jgi:hypothetical protein
VGGGGGQKFVVCSLIFGPGSFCCYLNADVDWRIFATSVARGSRWTQYTSGYPILVSTICSALCCLHCKRFVPSYVVAQCSDYAAVRKTRVRIPARANFRTNYREPWSAIQWGPFSLSSRVNRPGRQTDV